MSLQKKQIRTKFRNAVFARDKYSCKMCGFKKDLAAHHIVNRNNFPDGGYIKENGITLCKDCHLKAELVEEGFEPETLFKKI